MTTHRIRRSGARFGAVVCVASLTACSAVTSPALVPPGPPLGAAPGHGGSLQLLTEIYGGSGHLLEHRLRDGLANGAVLHPVPSPDERRMISAGRRSFAYFAIPPEANVSACYPNSSDPDASATLRDLGATGESRAWRLGMPEFDQSGGCWAQDRPSPAGVTDEQAYAAWTRFYLDTKGLRPLLETSAHDRGYGWMSVCVYAFCPQYAFDLGSDAVLLERNVDEVSGMSPGLAMVRGAARQNAGRDWGIDVSTYRYWNGGPTTFGEDGRLVTGWSPSTFERTMYAAYYGGADVILNEAANYGTGAADSGRNPLGAVVGDFVDFTLHRHPDRGVPEVPMAILQDHFSGYEPRFGEFDQTPRTWYRQHDYTPGDRTFDGLLDLAYPGYRSWGTIPATAPWRITAADGTVDVHATQAAYRRALSAPHTDPRTWEPMGSTRWGESIDVITDRARIDTLGRYQVVVLATTGPMTANLRSNLTEYVRQGGTVVLNAGQLEPGADPLTGTVVSAQRGTADSVTWSDGAAVADGAVTYVRVERDSDTPATDEAVVATTPTGDPAILRHALGTGSVYLVTADRMLDARGENVPASSRRLLDELQDAVASVKVDGPPLQYLTNLVGTGVVVTLINTDVNGSAWHGRVRFRTKSASASVVEWTADARVPSSIADGEVVADVTVPPFGVRVFAMRPGDRP